jgi:hypothetical protein
MRRAVKMLLKFFIMFSSVKNGKPIDAVLLITLKLDPKL